MGEGEGGGSLHDRAHPAEQQHQRHNEQQVIIPFKNMDHAEVQISLRHLPAVRHGRDFGGRAVIGQAIGLHRAAQRCNAQQRVGHAGFHALQADHLPVKGAGAGEGAGGDHRRSDQPGVARFERAEIGQQRLGAGGEAA